jgi:apolipoprotein N-acyltransferase
MIRATNTGATVIIDRFGHVTQALKRFTRGVLVGEVEGGTTMTPYARWVSHVGLLPLWLVAGAALLAALLARRRRPQP